MLGGFITSIFTGNAHGANKWHFHSASSVLLASSLSAFTALLGVSITELELKDEIFNGSRDAVPEKPNSPAAAKRSPASTTRLRKKNRATPSSTVPSSSSPSSSPSAVPKSHGHSVSHVLDSVRCKVWDVISKANHSYLKTSPEVCDLEKDIEDSERSGDASFVKQGSSGSGRCEQGAGSNALSPSSESNEASSTPRNNNSHNQIQIQKRPYVGGPIISPSDLAKALESYSASSTSHPSESLSSGTCDDRDPITGIRPLSPPPEHFRRRALAASASRVCLPTADPIPVHHGEQSAPRHPRLCDILSRELFIAPRSEVVASSSKRDETPRNTNL